MSVGVYWSKIDYWISFYRIFQIVVLFLGNSTIIDGRGGNVNVTAPVCIPGGEPVRLLEGSGSHILIDQDVSGDSLFVNVDTSGDDRVTSSGSGMESGDEDADDADDEYGGSGASGDGSVRLGGDGSSLRFKR